MPAKGFIQYLRSERRFSKHTIISYQTDLKQFFLFLESDFNCTNPTVASYDMLRSWIVALLEKKMSPRSVNRKIATLRSFYKFLLVKGEIKKSPALSLTSVKTPGRLPEFASQSTMDKLLDNIYFEKDFCGIRDKLILMTFYHSGMRLSELTHLKTQDVNLADNTLKVLGKRNKERIIPFGMELRDQVIQYIKKRNNMGCTNEIFFVTDKNKGLNNKFVYRLVNRYLGQVSSMKKKSPHVLRHTFATHMLNNGADINAVKEILGHANLTSTELYTHTTFEKLKKTHKQAHPRG